jgi:hypothetical protein
MSLLVWVCHDCDVFFTAEGPAITHCEQEDHWLYEHPGGFRGHVPGRSMHASDWGGVYIDDVSQGDGERLVRMYRERVGRGAF